MGGTELAVDLVVLAIVALAALRGWRRGGTALVLSLAGAVAGVFLGGALATWWDASSTVLLIVAVVVGGLIGLGVGRRLADALARRGDGRIARPHLLERVVGLVAHGGLALVLCVVVGAVLVAIGPSGLGQAVRGSSVLTATAAHLPTASQLAGHVPGLGRVVAVGSTS
ncbi:CvpA family protein [Actinomycetospora sp. TBRC 11914]|uniref:CvpA family protein n=1 Tax=Actinomycetospora sp. TBRC 11914 TaxID=2729387 RepID=UPI00145E2E68|nr:CvpA family protein [Actinomycetospora sp. TBRC 11914]NMO90575.1 CvpA family protein [Actinomycetospora sp. TBRC 11914]